MSWKRLFLVLTFFISALFLQPQDVSAQYQGELGSVSGSILWGSEATTIPSGSYTSYVEFVGNSGFTTQVYLGSSASYNSGYTLPPDTYTATLRAASVGGFTRNLGSQTVTVAAGQSYTVNFDMSTATGLVKGSLKVNGVATGGVVQFCETGTPCSVPFSANSGLYFNFNSSGFKLPILPGNYRVHVVTTNNVDMGIVSITVSKNTIDDLTTNSANLPVGNPPPQITLANITISFSSVTSAGFVVVTSTMHPQGGQFPSGYKLQGTYYNISTTATYTGNVTIVFPYDPSGLTLKQQENLKLLHWDGSGWQDITQEVNTTDNTITGISTSLSPFAVVLPISNPPTTNAELTMLNDDGTYSNPTTVTLSATAAEGYTVANTYYTIDGGEQQTYSSPFTVSGGGSHTITYWSVDNSGVPEAPNIKTFTIHTNQAPVITAISDTTINEGDTYSTNGSFTDSDSSSWIATVDYGDGSGVSPLTLSGTDFNLNHVYKDNGTYTVTVVVTDDYSESDTLTAAITVNNVAPSLGVITAPIDPIAINTPILVSDTFTDPGILDTHASVWDWGDETTSDGTITESNGSGSVSDSHSYTQAGVYTITLTVTDKDGVITSSQYQYVAVYDSSAGFITASGKYDSLAGWDLLDTQAEGIMKFGIQAKYVSGDTAPTGNSKLNFKVGDIDFNSTSYQWLVVNSSKAYLMGTGTVNGAGNYSIFVSAIDGSISGGWDLIRVRLTDNSTQNIIYDTQLGASIIADPTTVLTNGSIRVH